jgi:hypothetical protein
MVYEKFKGIVLEETLRRILAAAENVGRDEETGDIFYWNGKRNFIARRKSVLKWNIFNLIGA